MALSPSSVLPKNIRTALRKNHGTIQVSPKLVRIASVVAAEALAGLNSSATGLTEEEAQRRLEEFGPNVVASEETLYMAKALRHRMPEPSGDPAGSSSPPFHLPRPRVPRDLVSGILMVIMVVLGVSLRFIQAARADAAAAKLKAMIRVTATVVREGQAARSSVGRAGPGRHRPARRRGHDPRRRPHPLLQGSVSHPGQPDRRVLPRREIRRARRHSPATTPLELKNVCFLGTSVESGSATAVVVETGLKTYLGSMASAITGAAAADQLRQGHHPVSPGS